MAFQSNWYKTDLPDEIVEIMVRDLAKFNVDMDTSKLYNGAEDHARRNSKNAWVSTNNWIGSFCLNYVHKANRENFLYDITGFDGETMQYTQYGPGEHYTWHCDAGVSTLFKPSNTKESAGNDFVAAACEQVRKLSFVLQLSKPDEYSGGEFQFMDDGGGSYFAPKTRGTIIVFDSRSMHRVKRVREGVRRSLVGWVVGPRWK